MNNTIILQRTGRPGSWQFIELRRLNLPIFYGDCESREEALHRCENTLAARDIKRRARFNRWIRGEKKRERREGEL